MQQRLLAGVGLMCEAVFGRSKVCEGVIVRSNRDMSLIEVLRPRPSSTRLLVWPYSQLRYLEIELCQIISQFQAHLRRLYINPELGGVLRGTSNRADSAAEGYPI